MSKETKTRKPTATKNGKKARRAVRRRTEQDTVAYHIAEAIKAIRREREYYEAKIRAVTPAIEHLAKTGTPEERKVAKAWLKLGKEKGGVA